jgi:hypothetical protein
MKWTSSSAKRRCDRALVEPGDPAAVLERRGEDGAAVRPEVAAADLGSAWSHRRIVASEPEVPNMLANMV